MKVDHVFEEQLYLVSSHTVARNPLFIDKSHCQRFQEKVEKYLTPICEILEYCLLNNQFQLIVRIRNREAICDYYRIKKGNAEIPLNEIPLTNHIFSQAMANMLSSTAIWFNRKYKRSGALFARRFSKTLINSEVFLKSWIKKLHNLISKHVYIPKWGINDSNNQQFFRKVSGTKVISKVSMDWVVCGKSFTVGDSFRHPILKSLLSLKEVDLEAQFRFQVLTSFYSLKKTDKPPILKI